MAKKNNKTAHVLRLITTSEAPNIQDEDYIQDFPSSSAGLSFLSPWDRQKSTQQATPPLMVPLMPETVPAPEFPPEPVNKNLNVGVTSYVNLNELAVSLLCTKIMKRMNTCTCKKCMGFVVSHASSLLPEKFVNFIEGEALKKNYAAENSKELTAVILKACFKMKVTPLH